LAWDAFEEKNGAHSIREMRQRIEYYRHFTPTTEDYRIGCILLSQPFFFSENNWIPVPQDWSSNIVRGKGYNTEEALGAELWEKIKLQLQVAKLDTNLLVGVAETPTQYGSPITVMPRLGQGSFRVFVTDAYNRRCAVTEERTLPTLEASHVKPYSKNGPHHINNGILLRADIHKLLDAGYATISPDYHLEVSRRIKTDFNNGKNYYSMHGAKLRVPEREDLCPSREYITWHNENVFLG
jgi:putative restriction endonuclease